jgi:methyl-accepting chemotaxis protein
MVTTPGAFSLMQAIGLRSNELQLSDVRSRATKLYVALAWIHVPAVALIALIGHNAWQIPVAILAVTALIATASAYVLRDGLPLRAIIAVCLTMAPIAFVYAGRGSASGLNGTGDWQVDYHMYFFVIFAMLVAYVDWRPIAISAALTAVHHLILDLFVSSNVFPQEGLDRVALHALAVVAECAVLFWITAIVNALFVRINEVIDFTTLETAEVITREVQERERLQLALDEALARVSTGA